MGVVELLGLTRHELLSRDEKGTLQPVPAAQALSGKTVGLYFSAHWCPPCRAFTPQLAQTYQRLQQAGQDFELLYVSADRSVGEFAEYFAQMPWLALPYEATQLRSQLSAKFGVAGIPTLVILGPDGHVTAHNARAAVAADPEGRQFPWHGAKGGGGPSQQLIYVLLFIVMWFVSKFFTSTGSY